MIKNTNNNDDKSFDDILDEFIENQLSEVILSDDDDCDEQDSESDEEDDAEQERTVQPFSDFCLLLNREKSTSSGVFTAYLNPSSPSVLKFRAAGDYDYHKSIRFSIVRARDGVRVVDRPLSLYDINDSEREELPACMQPGAYYVELRDADLSAVPNWKKYGQAWRLPMRVVKMKSGAYDQKLVGATAELGRNKLLVRLQMSGMVDLLRDSRIDLYDRESLACVATGTGQASHCVAISEGLHSVVPGPYLAVASINRQPIATFPIDIDSSTATAGAIEELQPGSPMCNWAEMACQRTDYSPSNYYNVLLMKQAGCRSAKLAAAQAFHALCLENELAGKGLKALPMRRDYVLWGEPNEANLCAAKSLAKMAKLLPLTLNMVDCKELAPKREMPAQESSLLDDANFDGCVVIYNVGTLVSADMLHHCATLVRKMEKDREGGVVIVGTRAEVESLLQFCPALAPYFPAKQCIEAEPPSRRDALQMIVDAVKRSFDVGLTRSAVLAMRKSIEAWGTVDGWSRAKAKAYMSDGILPRYYSRLNTLHAKGALKAQVPMVEARDIDAKALASMGNCVDSFASSLTELDAMTGLDELKGRLRDMMQQTRFGQLRLAAGLPSRTLAACHTVFTGNPGTGKTTVAKLMGKLYRAVGLLSKGGVVVADRKRMVGQYIGETEYNMRQLLQEARGNVLFIDEAYNLVADPTDKRDFGFKAIDCLLTVLSQPNPDMVVVLAGYPKEMERLLQSNPGLESRFPMRLHFPDYTAEELAQIGLRMLKAEGYTLARDAVEAYKQAMRQAVAGKTRTFGNARWVEQFNQHGVLLSMARRLASAAAPTARQLSLITLADVREAESLFASPKVTKPLGFTH